MFKLTQDENLVRTTAEVTVNGDTVPANTTIPQGHRYWKVFEDWKAQGNTPLPHETAQERTDRLKKEVRAERDRRIDNFYWRIQRYERETRMGVSPTTDDLAAMDQYVKDLADVPEQAGFPETVNWPTEPA